ncbi:Nitrogenase-stabilizing/protective protein NifW [Frankia canadensis]|uniref:Nitrogenase-stabilizing/protective protein NifW n=1 Tax=Frankia canadensis TaxID=1836972 RepID=A0A2I2KYN7_9ACTN|nr:nitrogenase-stabilizing/protective protein NifW [Frankia canadensis]SNQ50783.1 Nitrogenase-stabilizing/protective protein NifW [Frankia canadensis]SOU58073.1 Nitrogenase-stabilizing/protective protein NifW [Frankia canadensis]
MSATGTAAARLAGFHRCSTAEEYFALLDVDFDPRVVAVNRLHILRVFSGELVKLHDAGDGERTDPEELLRDYRAALVRSYEAFLTATALDHRVFKVLKDRAPESAFVPSSEITVRRPGEDPSPAPSEQPEDAR